LHDPLSTSFYSLPLHDALPIYTCHELGHVAEGAVRLDGIQHRQPNTLPHHVVVGAESRRHVNDAGPILRGDEVRLDDVPAVDVGLVIAEIIEHRFITDADEITAAISLHDLVFPIHDAEPRLR